jgi:molybdate transport system permease protein
MIVSSAWLQVLEDPSVRYALSLTGRVVILTVMLHAVVGLLLGYLLSIPSWPGRGWLDALVMLPLVFPPMALGFVLLTLLGRHGVVGALLSDCCDIRLIFSVPGVVFASFVAGLPLVVKPVQAALEAVSSRLGEVARTLGKREWEIVLFVLLPNIRGALAAALALGLGRSLGEVGITLMLGGNIAGRTNTLSLEIYNAVFAGDESRAQALTLVLGAASWLVFLALRKGGVRGD